MICPHCQSLMVHAWDNKAYCRDCRKQFNIGYIRRRYIRW
jgi:DNA-directed RNA polymerase subunit M/transcription elongation factor TFIIS